MTDKPRQLTLSLPHRPALERADFLVSDTNRAAFAAITDARDAPGRLALSGPEGAGKTHLAAVWAGMHHAGVLAAAGLTEEMVGALTDLPAVVIEDVDRVGDLAADRRREVEALLFHVLNLAAAHGIALLITGRSAPARWRIATPDLASRLNALPHVAIAPPDDALLSSILEKLFSDRRLSVGADAKKFLLVRMERTFVAAERVVARLDNMALAGRRAVTRNLASELYETDPDVITGTGDP